MGGAEPRRGFAVPHHGRELEGSDLRAQARRWVDAGVAEPSLLPALDAANSHPEWFDLSRTTVVVLGAGGGAGPAAGVVVLGAQVLAVDLPDADRWRRIIAAAEGTPGCCMSRCPGVSVAASGADADEVAQVAGADLLTRLPDVAAWIAGFDGPVVLGNYLYADGATECAPVGGVRRAGPVPVRPWLRSHPCFPCHPLPTPSRWAPTSCWTPGSAGIGTCWPGRPGGRCGWRTCSSRTIRRCCVTTTAETCRPTAWCRSRGPNYLLAKRMQRWRAVVNRESGLRVSLNVALATRTRSVVKNRLLAAAYAGAGRFGMEIFEPDTTNALMGRSWSAT